MSTLKQMGIQQWRKRDDLSLAPQAPTIPALEATPQHSAATPVQQAAPVIDQPADRLETEQAPIVEPQLDQPSIKVATPVENNEAETELDWDAVSQSLYDTNTCRSCSDATPILGEGNRQADSLFVVSMPSTNDVQRQQLLSGRDGQLFDAMLNAMNLTRPNVYLTSASKCYAESDSISNKACSAVVHQQLTLVKPKVIVVFGERAAQWIIKSNESLPTLRADAQKCHRNDIPVVVTHSLSTLLAQPKLKAQAWQDLRRAIRVLSDHNTPESN